MQAFVHTCVPEWKKNNNAETVNWVRIYLARLGSKALVQDEGSELPSVELMPLLSVLGQINLALTLSVHVPLPSYYLVQLQYLFF